MTLRLDLASTTPFCDPVQYGNCFNDHITIWTLAGQPLTVDAYGCGVMICSSECVPPPCTDGICISGGPVISPVEKIWDGSYYEASTCGQGLGCVIRKYVPAGRYVARTCATPGMINGSEADGGTPTCTTTGQQECVDTPFDLPGPSPIEATLP